jgi:predicted component of type VI protein secretion system
VARSTVNYGMPEHTGRTASNVTPTRLEQMVQESVAAFEPRIMRKTLAVKAVSVAAGRRGQPGNSLGFEISGELCPLPMPEPPARTQLAPERPALGGEGEGLRNVNGTRNGGGPARRAVIVDPR